VFNPTFGTNYLGCTVRVYDPVNTQIGFGYCGTGASSFIDTLTLGTTGTYTILIDPQDTSTGSVSVSINNDADVTGTIAIGGSAFSFTTIAGQNANVTFSNPQSQSVTINWTTGTYTSSYGCYMPVTGPSPSTNQVGYANCNTASGTLPLGTQPAGTYNILVDPQAQSAGGMSLTATTP